MSEKRGGYTRTPEVPPELLGRFAIVIATLGGTLTVSEGARRLGLSRVQFQTVVHRALGAVVESLQPRPSGPKPESDEVKKLKAEIARLEDELAEAQDQAAMFQRFMGVASDLLHGRIKTGRARKSKKTPASSSPSSPTPEPEPEPDPAEARRREVVSWASQMRSARVHPVLITGLLGASPATLGRWRRRLLSGERLRRRRAGSWSGAVDVNQLLGVVGRVRETHGLVGVESLRHSVGAGLTRRILAGIKKSTVTAMERERVSGCTRVEVTVPGVVRGFDAMEVRCAEGRRWALVCTDAAVPHRTTVALVESYDSEHVLQVLLRDIIEHGAPLVLRMDRASCQRTPEVRRMLEDLGVLVLHGPPRCPQYYGQLERQNREHRAWLRGLDGAPEAVLAAALVQMQHVLNASWARPTLGWETAEGVWTERPEVRDDRAVLATEVQERTARIMSSNDNERSLDELAARRLATEHALRERGYLSLKAGRSAK